MPYPRALHNRRRPIHQPVVHRPHTPPIIFLTVCARGRRPILARDDAAAAIVTAWRGAKSWAVGRYVIMPDHVHCFCSPADEEVRLARWVQYWKALASRLWPQRHERPVWQRDFWDTQLRRCESYEAKWEYVYRNPVRRGLVAAPEEWPYQGEIVPLWWDD